MKEIEKISELKKTKHDMFKDQRELTSKINEIIERLNALEKLEKENREAQVRSEEVRSRLHQVLIKARNALLSKT